MRRALVAATLLFVACSSNESPRADDTTTPPTTAPTTEAPTTDGFSVGAASASILPTVGGTTDYLADAPGWAADGADPDDIGVFVPAFDQGDVAVSNGNGDASWVHDDVRATAVALERSGSRAVILGLDTYMTFSMDADEIESIVKESLPPVWQDAPILIAPTHNHHGPDVAFDINPDYYAHLAQRAAAAVVDAVANMRPARAVAATDEHRFGVSDGRDPIVFDPRLNVIHFSSLDDGSAIATIVQWNSHPETTLGWEPPVPDLEARCADKGWSADDCYADGRYFTADYPGVLRTRLQQNGFAEVVYMNGPLGNQIGPGEADVWRIDDSHPVGNGWVAPQGAEPVAGCDDYRCRNLARTDAIGSELARHVMALIEAAPETSIDKVEWTVQPFYTRLTNIGFRLLIADGDLGWRSPVLYTCDPGIPATDDTCRSDEGAVIDDPILTPLTDSQIRVGDFVKTRVSFLDLGSVGFIFMPGELPPEFVVGLPADFDTEPSKYYIDGDGLHAEGSDYVLPGYLLSLVDREVTFTVGLGEDELGYWVPTSDYRLKCLEIVFTNGQTCADLNARGVIEQADSISGTTCKSIVDEPTNLAAYEAVDAEAISAICRYGQALGRELGEPEGHYEETNAAGWDLVDDLWAAVTTLFGAQGTGRINPGNSGYTIQHPPT
ncbi:MAG: hypothetical protein ACKOCE_01145 [Acidimicrobiia bacterium]